MSFTLNELQIILNAQAINPPETPISLTGISANSAAVVPGSLFVAVNGVKADGHSFVSDAFQKGASAAVVSDASSLAGEPGLVVDDTRKALSRLASLFAGDPSKTMTCIGITGTNGKTTIHWLLYHLLASLGRKPLRIGTLGAYAEGILQRKEGLTTPDPIRVHQDIAYAKEHGADVAIMETSSHALDQHRVRDVEFDVAVFTNLTRDHLDYHGDMESYFASKQRLFEMVGANSKRAKGAVVNIDCPYGKRLAGMGGVNVITYGTSRDATLRISSMEAYSDRSLFDLTYGTVASRVETRFIGRHNALNIAAAVGACLALGSAFDDVVRVLPGLPQVPGRLEYAQGKGFDIFVDYAHTPDALENALSALREVTKGKLWVVFGCGGDRDRGKRPQMAEVAARMADRVVVTSDNPRTEDPAQIISDILSTGMKPLIAEVDRSKAITETLKKAEPGDVVLIAGKGHEDYQIVGTAKRHFSDFEEVEKALGELQ